MKRLTKRTKNGKVYVTATLPVCWGGRTADERMFCVNCHGAKDNRGIDRSKCGPLAVIDRLAAYEDTGLTPDEITALIAPQNDPLTMDELREMDGEPVWVVLAKSGDGEWCLVNTQEEEVNSAHYEFCEFADYGNMWHAYRRKPEKELA